MLTPTEHILWIMVMSVIFIAVAVALAYLSRWQAAPVAYIALCTGCLSGYASEDTAQLIFWAAATVIVLGISYLLPAQVRNSRVGVGYMSTGALAGCFVGMLLNSLAGVVTATAAGVALGLVAYSRLADGERLDFPSRKFLNYLCAKGLPLVVTFSMIGLLAMQLIAPAQGQ